MIQYLELPAETLRAAFNGRELVPLAIGRDEGESHIEVLFRLTGSVGTVTLGDLEVSVGGLVGNTLAVTTARWPPRPSDRLLQQVETLRWQAGHLSVDTGERLLCCYQNTGCMASVP